MTALLGEYEATLDAKGRFLLPAGLKKQLPEEEGGSSFVLNRGFEKCLVLWPKMKWELIIEKLSKLNDFDPKVRQFKLQFLGGATEVTLDSAGRMLLPPSLKDYANLSKDIVLACDIDKVKIWDAARYKQFFENISPEDFSQLASEVMGGGNIEL
ncbi:MAG TPA: division/cell wall cluster transcriptional repressor MraZ [Parasegetibacter sp.]|jgi:MraZ protein